MITKAVLILLLLKRFGLTFSTHSALTLFEMSKCCKYVFQCAGQERGRLQPQIPTRCARPGVTSHQAMASCAVA